MSLQGTILDYNRVALDCDNTTAKGQGMKSKHEDDMISRDRHGKLVSPSPSTHRTL